MRQSEIMQRVVGILTEAIEMRRQVRENPDAEVALTGSISALLAETLPEIKLPADASAQESKAVVAEALGPAIIESLQLLLLRFRAPGRGARRGPHRYLDRRSPALPVPPVRPAGRRSDAPSGDQRFPYRTDLGRACVEERGVRGRGGGSGVLCGEVGRP